MVVGRPVERDGVGAAVVLGVGVGRTLALRVGAAELLRTAIVVRVGTAEVGPPNAGGVRPATGLRPVPGVGPAVPDRPAPKATDPRWSARPAGSATPSLARGCAGSPLGNATGSSRPGRPTPPSTLTASTTSPARQTSTAPRSPIRAQSARRPLSSTNTARCCADALCFPRFTRAIAAR